jgi:hypothetical protein
VGWLVSTKVAHADVEGGRRGLCSSADAETAAEASGERTRLTAMRDETIRDESRQQQGEAAEEAAAVVVVVVMAGVVVERLLLGEAVVPSLSAQWSRSWSGFSLARVPT